MFQQIIDLDIKLFLLINSFSDSKLDYLLGWPTYLGDSLFFLPITFLFLLIWIEQKTAVKYFILTFLSVAVAGLFVRILKSLFDRDRPYNYFYEMIDKGQVSVNYLFGMDTANSFPSGHSAAIFACATALNGLFDNKLFFLYPLAAWIAITRVYVGAHFPLDIVIGALAGVLIGALFIKYTKPFIINQDLQS